MRRSINVKFWNGAVYTARLIGSDSSTDLAVVRVSAPSSILHPLTLANSDLVQVGDGVLAIGSPFGLAGTVTSGIVSALHRSMTSPNHFTIGDSIQTDAPINHGNSGGPLLNSAGRVIGVTTQIQTDSGGSDGVGFAVPSNTIQRIAPKLVAGLKVQHAYLGIFVSDASTAGNATAGALAGTVKAGTPAARAGLQSGDVIVALDGTTISSSDDLTRVLDLKQPGDALKVTYLRDGKSHTRHRHARDPPVVSPGRKRALVAGAAGLVVAGAVTAVAATQFDSHHKVTVVAPAVAKQQAGPGTFNGQVAPGGEPGGRFGRSFGRGGSSLAAAASYIGVTEQALVAELAGGKTLAQVAKDHGKSADGLVSAMLAAEKKVIEATEIRRPRRTRSSLPSSSG